MKVKYKTSEEYNICLELKRKLVDFKRKEKLTWIKLSILCDITSRELRMIRTEKRKPTFDVIVKIGKALDMSLDELCSFVYDHNTEVVIK